MSRPLAAALFGLAAVWPLRVEAGAGFAYPAPGTYRLDHIFRAPDGVVLEGDRVPRLLSRYAAGAITLLAFFYTSCADPQGCPLAWEAFEDLRARLKERPDLQGEVRLVFISLDPARDTPAMLQTLARGYQAEAGVPPWHFLTTYSNLFLKPLLSGFGEEIAIDREASSASRPVFSHMLKVFLIDRQGDVREIYSNQSLDVVAILGDIETLAVEAGKEKKR